jgi:GT2 family glycosyltransferase
VPPSCSVVIATLGARASLQRAIDAAASSTARPAEILVVDGDPGAAASAAVRDADPAGVPVRHLRAPRGLTRQRNVGLDAAVADVVVFVDDDARLRVDALAHLLAAYDDPSVVAATGRVVEPSSNRVAGKSSRVRRALFGRAREGRMTRFGYPRRLVDEVADRDVEFMAGCFMSVRADVGRAVRFDERLSGYALAEDEDFGYRVSRVGRVRYVGGAVVDHDNAGFGQRDRREFGRAVVVNRAYLFSKNFAQTPAARLQFVLLVPILIAHRAINRDWRGMLGLAQGARAAARMRRTGAWEV